MTPEENRQKPSFSHSLVELVAQMSVYAALSLVLAFMVGAWARLVYELFMAGWRWIA